MQAVQLNKLAMYRAVSALLVTSSNTLRDIPALPDKITTLNKKIGEITSLAATQAQSTRGTVGDRDAALEDTAHLALVIAGAVLSYASEKQLNELAAKVRLTPTDFWGGRNEDCVRLAQSVHDAAQSVVGELGNYGVSAETLATLSTKIASSTLALSAPRGMMTARKAATQQLKVVFRQVDSLLANEIDPLLVPLTKSNPQWHAKYRAARIIIDHPGGRTGVGNVGNGQGEAAPPATPATPAGRGANA